MTSNQKALKTYWRTRLQDGQYVGWRKSIIEAETKPEQWETIAVVNTHSLAKHMVELHNATVDLP